VADDKCKNENHPTMWTTISSALAGFGEAMDLLKVLLVIGLLIALVVYYL
jgi:hypothetical protein